MELIIFYSPAVNGFYDSRLLKEYKASNSLPSDITEMTSEEVSTYYMTVPPAGKKLGALNGRASWIDIPPPTQEQLVAAAEQQKAALLLEAQATISIWQTELQLGIISDEDKTSLIAWMNYIKAVQAVDTSKAPDIIWPDKPE
ncbi:tail fiber assembly protein [Salmonella enterica]|nr:tail fiber assembly protein [Salmonella enterica]MDJ7514733.1 tail fiber assembly protein [Salmonella enterica]MDL3269080.1 tail fiber assembly protein [Salmonella enterica]